jgi:hypothetical protein
VLWTDGSVGRGRELVGQMEYLRQVIFGVGFPVTEQHDHNVVIALRDVDEFHAYAPEGFLGFAWPDGNPLGEPFVVIPAEFDELNGTLVTHELAHVISHHVIHHQPPWFAEGLAEFFATVRLDPSKSSGDIGMPVPRILKRLRTGGRVPMAQMFACRDRRCMSPEFYATAWGMFAYLANQYPAELLRYAAALDAVSEAQAWHDVFPALTPDKLDTDLREWLFYGKSRVWKFKVAVQKPAIKESKLGDADVIASRGLLRYLFDPSDPRAKAAITEAKRLEPTNLLAALVEAQIEKAPPIEPIRALTVAHPDDWRAWWLLFRRLDPARAGDEAKAARDRACALQPALDGCEKPARDGSAR